MDRKTISKYWAELYINSFSNLTHVGSSKFSQVPTALQSTIHRNVEIQTRVNSNVTSTQPDASSGGISSEYPPITQYRAITETNNTRNASHSPSHNNTYWTWGSLIQYTNCLLYMRANYNIPVILPLRDRLICCGLYSRRVDTILLRVRWAGGCLY